MMDNKYPINHEWKDYYIVLEGIRQSGICNMWGSSPVLASTVGISHDLAERILCSWISNYEELRETYWPVIDEQFWATISKFMED